MFQLGLDFYKLRPAGLCRHCSLLVINFWSGLWTPPWERVTESVMQFSVWTQSNVTANLLKIAPWHVTAAADSSGFISPYFVAAEQSCRTRSTTESGVWCRCVFTRLLSETSVSWNSVSSAPGQVYLRTSLTTQLTSSTYDCERVPVWRPGTPLWALKPALFHYFQNKHSRVIFGMQFDRQ